MNYKSFFTNNVGIQKLKWTGKQGMGVCPLPNHTDRTPSFSCCGETSQWNCFGCGMNGNAYTLAKLLNLDNPHQYIDVDSKNYTTNGYEPYSTPKCKVKDTDTAKKMQKYGELKKKYGDRVTLGESYKDKYIGKDDYGNIVFIYPKGIKVHKKYWITNASLDSSSQIFMADELSSFDKSKPLHIFEGEKDALTSPLQGVAFSSGAKSIPKDIQILYEFESIIIVYDNDDAGRNGARALARRIKKESPKTIVKIAQWGSTLPNGYDVYDDWKKTHGEETNNAIVNANEIELVDHENNEIEEETKGYTLMRPEELIETFTKNPKSIVDNLIVEKGVTLISGTDGVGKTWFGLQLAISIASGKEFLGLNVVRKPVLMIQFELSSAQLSDRLKRYDRSGTEEFLHFSILKDQDLIFTDAWKKIAHTIETSSFNNGVIIIDNLYTSTNRDLSKNHELKPLLTTLNHIKNVSNNAFVLIAHHNLHDGDNEPILCKSIITGGKTLTNYVSNVFQIGNSSMGADIRRAKFTKMRDSYTERLNEPLRLIFNPDTCLFEYSGVIHLEKLHCEPVKKRWEYMVLVDFADINAKKPDFDRRTIQLFMEGAFSDLTPDNISKKTTRWLNKMMEFGLIKKKKHGDYKLNFDAIKELNIED